MDRTVCNEMSIRFLLAKVSGQLPKNFLIGSPLGAKDSCKKDGPGSYMEKSIVFSFFLDINVSEYWDNEGNVIISTSI